jgi:hypothetical protein
MSFHDEPLVVDNGPLGIDVGQKHADDATLLMESGDNWIRNVSQFNQILLICKKGAGVNGEVETRITPLSRDPGKDLKLTLANGSTLTLSWSGPGHDTLTIKPSNFKFSKNGRRLTQGNGNLKIVSLTWFQSDDQVNPTRFPTTGESNHDSIFVGLYS